MAHNFNVIKGNNILINLNIVTKTTQYKYTIVLWEHSHLMKEMFHLVGMAPSSYEDAVFVVVF